MITKKKKREELQLLSQEALDAYMNRPDFQYDANGDALYRHYKDQYTELGKRAMQDTMGQASTLTGGYGSSYAQNVGQQAYQSYLSKADDVIPALYQLAYDRYRDKGDRLYKTYQSWSQLEQQAAQQEQWEREYELEERKRQDANREFQLEQERKNSQTQTSQTQTAAYHKLGQNNSTAAVDTTAAEPAYDNGKVSEGNVKTMQRVLGLKETGKWTDLERTGAGGLSADDAWKDYQQGKLQNRKSVGLGDQGLANGNVKAMERMLGLKEDGYWSEEDKQAAGGLSEANAWDAYQRGLLRKRNTQVNNKVLTEGDIKSMERVLGLTEDGVWSAEDQKAAKGFSAATAWEAYQSGALQRWKSKGLFEHGTSNNSTKPQKSSNNTLPQIDPVKPESNYNDYLTAQKQIQTYIEKLNREIYLMENDYVIYEDLTTREIGKAEEPKLAQFRQKYPSLYDMQDAIEEMKEQTKQLHALAEWAGQEAEYLKNYSDKTYNELQTVLESLEEGTERNWVANYALSKMTSQEMKTESAKVNWEYERLSTLLDQYKMLTRIEQPAEGRAKIKQIAAVYGSVTDLEDRVAAIKKQKYYLDNALRFNNLSENEDFAELSQAQGNGSWMYKMVNDPSTAGIFDVVTSVGKYVGPMVGTASLAYDAFNFDNLQYMNDEERATFNYVYAKEGEKAAREYLDYLEYSLNERSMHKAMEWMSEKTEDAPVLASLISVPLGLMGGHGWVDVAGQYLGNKVTGDYKPIDYNRDATFFNRASSTIRDTAEQKITETAGDFWGGAYQLGMNMLDSKAVDALKKVHPALGFALAGSSASTQAMLDAKQRGATDEQALTMGIFGGCFDMLVGAFGASKFLQMDGPLLKEMIGEKIDGKIKEILNAAAEYIIIATNSNYERDVVRYLEVNSTWSYEHAQKQALIDAALKLAEEDIDQLSGLVLVP